VEATSEEICMTPIDLDKLVQSFIDRREEADPRARQVLDEFIRITKNMPANSTSWQEVISLDQNWRDTLSDSQVINYLRSLHPVRAARTRNRRAGNS
jgi:hypothetical protein